MIFVNDDWVIGVDANNYMVSRNKPVISKRKDGTESVSYLYEAYFRDLAGAVEYIVREEQRKVVGGGDMSLAEAVQAIRKSNAEIRAVIEAAVRS